MRVGDTDGDIVKANARGNNGDDRLYAFAAERNGRGRIGGTANYADRASRVADAGRSKADGERKALACGKSDGTVEAADGEARAGVGQLGNADVVRSGVRERKGARRGSADQSDTETQVRGARVKQVGLRGSCGCCGAEDADGQNLGMSMASFCRESDSATRATRGGRLERHVKRNAGMGTECERRCRTAQEENSWKAAGNLEERNRLAAGVANDNVGGRGCASRSHGDRAKG